MSLIKQYDVLEILPKKQIFKVFVRCVLENVIMLMRWLFEGLKGRVHQTTIMRKAIEQVQFPTMQPNIMTETRMGRHSYVKLENTKLHYIEAGNRSNSTVLLLHGFPDSWLGWRYQISELSEFFHVIALDLKGFNDSDKPLWRFEYTPKRICEELRKFLIAISAKSVSIVGHDLGAIIGWTFAHTNPELVDKFVSVATPHPNLLWDNLPPTSPFNRRWMEFVQLPYLPELEMQRNAERTLKKCHPNIVKEKMYIGGKNGSAINNLMEAYKYTFSQMDDWRGPLHYYRNFMFFRIREGEILQFPCMIITGNQDRIHNLDTVVKSGDYCQNASIKIIENAGHAPHQEASTQFNTLLLGFLLGKRISLKPTETNTSPRSQGIMNRFIGTLGSAANTTVTIGKNTIISAIPNVPSFILKS